MKIFIKQYCVNVLHMFILVIALIFAVSCREPFDYVPQETQQKILVVEGLITDKNEQYLVRISYASPYNIVENEVVKGARVFVQDNNGNIYNFLDSKNGNYLSDSSSFVGKLGNTYTLFIKTAEGLEYRSTTCTLTPNEIKIDSLYGLNEQFLIMSGTSELFNDYTTAYHLYVDLSYNANQKTNVRCEVILASPYEFTSMHYITESNEEIDEKNDAVVDSFSTLYKGYSLSNANKLPVIITNTDYTSVAELKKIPLTYIYPNRDTNFMNPKSPIIYTDKWVVQLKAYSITNETFDYYYKIIKQLSGKNTFFEPIPVQLTGNIICMSDSTIPVFGLFEANAVVSKFIGVTYGAMYKGQKYKTYIASGWPKISVDTFRFDFPDFEIPGIDTTSIMVKSKSINKH